MYVDVVHGLRRTAVFYRKKTELRCGRGQEGNRPDILLPLRVFGR